MIRQDAVTRISLDTSTVPASAAKASKAIGSIGKSAEISAGQTRNAIRQLPAQFTDIATQLAGGQSPALILLQQGGQIRDSFGSIGGALRGIASIINPVSLAIGGVAAAIGGLGFAAFSGGKEAAKLRDDLILTGNAAGVTEDRVRSLAEGISDSSGQTLGEVRELIGTLVESGRVSGVVLRSTGEAIARVAELSGRAAKEIAASFAGQLSDPARVAQKLNDQYNFLNEAQARRIRQLQDEGRKADAANLTNELLNKALTSQTRELGFLERGWNFVTKRVSDYIQALKDLGRPDTTGQALEATRERLQQLEARLGAAPRFGRSSRGVIQAQINKARADLAQLAEQIKQENAAADAAADRAARRDDINDILTGRPGKSPKPAARDAFEIDPGVSAAARALAQTDTAKLQALNDQLRALFTLEGDEGGGPAVAQAIAATQRELQTLIDTITAANLPAPAVDLRSDFLRSEKAGYEATEQFLAEQSAAAQKRLDDIAQRARDNIQDAIGSTFTQAFEGQFDSIEDLWKGLIKRMLAEALAADLASALFGKGSGGNVASLFGNIIGAIGGFFGGGRASGGPVSAGGTYLVGERGPELLMMGGRSGTVVPNDAMGGTTFSMGGPTIYIDGRSDQAQLAQMVAAGMAQAQEGMWRQLRARGLA
jgi:phage-related minor tail protein